MKFLELLAAIVATFEARLNTGSPKPLGTIRWFGGQVAADELLRLSVSLPGILVCMTGFRSPQTADTRATVQLAAFVIAKGGKGTDGKLIEKDAQALVIAEAVTRILGCTVHQQSDDDEDLGPLNRWGLAVTGDVMNLQADNLFSTRTVQGGVAIWGIRWDQTIELPEDTVADLTAFVTANLTWNLSDGTPPPEGGDAQDSVVLEQETP